MAVMTAPSPMICVTCDCIKLERKMFETEMGWEVAQPYVEESWMRVTLDL